jgi:hypothetical protein
MPKKRSSAKPNPSYFLPSLLDAFGGSGFQSRKRKLADEAIELTRDVFAGPPEGMERHGPGFSVDSSDTRLLGELVATLKYRGQRARESADARNTSDAKACARAYSTCLQTCLMDWGVASPGGVFRQDITTPGSGPRIPERAFRAAILKAKIGAGAHKIAQAMASDYPGDYSTAAKKAEKDLARTVEPFRGGRRYGPKGQSPLSEPSESDTASKRSRK